MDIGVPGMQAFLTSTASHTEGRLAEPVIFLTSLLHLTRSFDRIFQFDPFPLSLCPSAPFSAPVFVCLPLCFSSLCRSACFYVPVSVRLHFSICLFSWCVLSVSLRVFWAVYHFLSFLLWLLINCFSVFVSVSIPHSLIPHSPSLSLYSTPGPIPHHTLSFLHFPWCHKSPLVHISDDVHAKLWVSVWMCASTCACVYLH